MRSVTKPLPYYNFSPPVKLILIPVPKSEQNVENGRGRKRVEGAEKPIQDAIASYKKVLAEYEQAAETASHEYSSIEIAKLKVADAFLVSLTGKVRIVWRSPRGPFRGGFQN